MDGWVDGWVDGWAASASLARERARELEPQYDLIPQNSKFGRRAM